MRTGIYILTPLLGWFAAQGIKFVLSLRQDGFQIRDVMQSGGMPSSHTAFMTALLTVLAIGEGLESPVFALCLALTAIVAYDAAGVRRATGQQTAAIDELARKTGTKLTTPIVNARGHTWTQIFFGAVLGLVIGGVMSFGL